MSTHSPYELKVAWEQVDEIIKGELRSIYYDMDEALEKIENGEQRTCMFDHDEDLDAQMIQAHMNAAALLLEYYGEKL